MSYYWYNVYGDHLFFLGIRAGTGLGGRVNPFRTPVPFWGQITWN